MQPTHPTTAFPQPLAQRRNPLIDKNFVNKQALALGILQLLMGLLCMIFNIAGICIGSEAQYGATGIWLGIMFVFAGHSGIVAGKRKLKGWYIAFMIVSIISVCVTPGIIIQASIGLTTETLEIFRGDPQRTPKMFLHGALLTCALLEAIFAIWSSIVCCTAVCCGRKKNASHMPGQMVVYYSNGQPMIQPGQPVTVVNQAQPGTMLTTPCGPIGPPPYDQLSAGNPVASPPPYQIPPQAEEKNTI